MLHLNIHKGNITQHPGVEDQWEEENLDGEDLEAQLYVTIMVNRDIFLGIV